MPRRVRHPQAPSRLIKLREERRANEAVADALARSASTGSSTRHRPPARNRIIADQLMVSIDVSGIHLR